MLLYEAGQSRLLAWRRISMRGPPPSCQPVPSQLPQSQAKAKWAHSKPLDQSSYLLRSRGVSRQGRQIAKCQQASRSPGRYTLMCLVVLFKVPRVSQSCEQRRRQRPAVSFQDKSSCQFPGVIVHITANGVLVRHFPIDKIEWYMFSPPLTRLFPVSPPEFDKDSNASSPGQIYASPPRKLRVGPVLFYVISVSP